MLKMLHKNMGKIINYKKKVNLREIHLKSYTIQSNSEILIQNKKKSFQIRGISLKGKTHFYSLYLVITTHPL